MSILKIKIKKMKKLSMVEYIELLYNSTTHPFLARSFLYLYPFGDVITDVITNADSNINDFSKSFTIIKFTTSIYTLQLMVPLILMLLQIPVDVLLQ